MNSARKVFSVVVFAAFLLSPAMALAMGPEPTMQDLMQEIQALKQRVAVLEGELAVQQGEIGKHAEVIEKEKLQDISAEMKSRLENLKHIAGLDIGARANFIGQGTANANNVGQGENSRFDASYTMEIEIGKQFGDWGYAYFLMEPGQGNGLDNYLSLFSIVNFDAYDTASNPTITEVWYEHYFFDGQLTLTGGKLYFLNYLDTNEYANDENRQFLGRMFRNADTIELPSRDWCLGARMYVAPEALDFLELETLWGDADCDWDQIFDHAFTAAQLNFMPAKAFDYDEEMWGGNYRIYYWYHGDDHTDLEKPSKNKRRNYGFGLSCDQKITDVFGVFSRFGWQNPEVDTLEYCWSVGGQMTGKFWNREKDVLALGVGQVIPGVPYGNTGNPNNNETHLETYYSLYLNDHLTVSPDLQFIWRPNGVGNKEQGQKNTIFVYGVRGFVEF